MPRYIKTDYGQSILLPIKLSKQLIPGTLEFTIDKIVETRIDMTPFENKILNDETGSPVWNPKILLKIILLAYSRCIFTSRRIKNACEENITFIAISEIIKN
jgi:transposase